MLRWLVLIAILLFIAGQLTRLRPSARDKQLQRLRQTATRAGLQVGFWTVRNSGFSLRQLPASGFTYQLLWPPKCAVPAPFALWIAADGEMTALISPVPGEVRDCLAVFRQRFPDGWFLLEGTEQGLRLLWQERGDENDVQAMTEALHRLREQLLALPGR